MTKCVWLGCEPVRYGGFSVRCVVVGTGPFVFLLSCKRRHRHWWLMESGSASGVIILDHIYYWIRLDQDGKEIREVFER